MTGEHLIIKSRTVAAELRKTRPGTAAGRADARKLFRLAARWEALLLAQYKLHREAAWREGAV